MLRAKVSGRTIVPALVQPDKPAILSAAEEVCALYAGAVSDSRRLGEVLADLDALCSERRDHRMVRGMAHLVRSRCTLEANAEIDPVDLRTEVFRLAAARGPLALKAGPFERTVAGDILTEIGAARGLSAGAVRDGLFADHDHERRLAVCDVPGPGWLIHRYNVALVQGLLRSARDVIVRLDDPTAPRMRQLFRWVKFHQLLHRARREDGRLVLRLDGPVSLFRGSTRYGQRLARFLPALLLQDRPWRLVATVEWGRARHPKELVVTHDDGLVTHYADTGAYRTRTQEHLVTTFTDAKHAWTLQEGQLPIALGPDELVFPDFTLTDGSRTVDLEVWGHWRPEALQRRLAALDRYGPRPLIVAVPSKLASGQSKDIPEHPQVLPFSELLSVRKLLAAADRIATLPGDPPTRQ